MTSPLAEANPASLEENFSASPLERKPEEWITLVTALRAQRVKWLQEEASGAKRASSTTAKRPPKTAAKADISLDDLDF